MTRRLPVSPSPGPLEELGVGYVLSLKKSHCWWQLPDLATWYLTTNLPVPSERSERATGGDLAPASVAEVVRLYGLRMWVEQSYEPVKHALGWSDYQVRSDVAIRRHWQLVLCAFSFCWWAYGRLPASSDDPAEHQEGDLPAGSSKCGEREDPYS